MENPSRLPLYLGVLLLIAGWAVIMLAWYQSGRQDLETGQIPYVISGGFGGFGLILMGVVSMLVDVVRQAEFKLRRSAEHLHERMEGLAQMFVDGSAPAGSVATRTPRNARRRRSSTASAD